MKQLSKARLRALHPHTEPLQRIHDEKRIEITVAIHQSTYEWLAEAAERPGTFPNIEELVVDALNLVAGKGCPRTHLLRIAQMHGIRPETLLFGDIQGSAERQAVSALCAATEILAQQAHFGFVPDGEDLSVGRLLAMISLSLQGQRDAAAQMIDPALHAVRGVDIQMPYYPQNHPPLDDDDGIPF
ncbi:MAG: hypothetical protein F9K34_09745 [Albidovulum sp.]|uniref:hypothetical protein n=1 Tax=Albidovulum sp. TaxID=1872424 RepID=UPI001322F425|nr:hypothetical protein [Defluviimonas sp.]KAB2884139.1 MAG: hypothetical protein F9K34_09745 [Defluviimonas sp.]